MAWGFFNKIKKGLKKAGKWIKDKVINPIVKPVLGIAKKAAPAVGMLANTIVPGSGALVNGAVDIADGIVNRNDFEPLSRRIRLK